MQSAMQPSLLNSDLTLSEVPSVVPATFGSTPLFAEEIGLVSQSYAGRCYLALNDGFSLVTKKIVSFAQGFFVVVSSLGSDTNTVASIFRKMDRHIIQGIEYLSNMPGHLNKLTRALRHTVGLIDTMQVFTDLDYFYNCKYQNEKTFAFISKITVVAADVGGALLWFEEMSFIHLSAIANSIADIRVFGFVPKVVDTISKLPGVGSLPRLSKIASTIGEIRLFSCITKTSMYFIAVRALTLTYIFLALDAAQRLINSGNHTQKTQAGLDLSTYLSELVLDALMTVGVANLCVMGVAGSAAIALVIASFAHKVLNEEALKQAELMPIKEHTEKLCVIT